MNGDRFEAEDALSESMIKARQRIETFAGEIRNVEAWLTRLAYNHCIDQRRQRKRMPVTGDEATLGDRSNKSFRTADLPDNQLIVTEKTQSLFHFATELSPNLKVPFVMHFLHEKPYAVIAEQCGLTIANVRKRIQMARDELRERLNDLDTGKRRAPTRNGGGGLNSEPVEASREEGKPNFALELETAGGVLPSGVWLNAHVYVTERSVGSRRKKLETLRRYVERHPNGWKKRLQLAGLCEQCGLWQEAVSHYDFVFAKKMERPEAAWRLARLWRILGRPDEAARVMRQASERVVSQALVKTFLGWSAHCELRVAEAERLLGQAAVSYPGSSFVQYCWGAFLSQTGRAEMALRGFYQALRAEPGHLPSMSQVVEISRLVEPHQTYLHRLETLLRQHPNHPLALRRMVEIRCVQSADPARDEGLRQMLEQLRDHCDGAAFYLEAFCDYYRAIDREDQALSLLQDFVKRRPDSPGGWCRLAHLRFSLGFKNDGMRALHRAKSLFKRAFGESVSSVPENEAQLVRALSANPLLAENARFL